MNDLNEIDQAIEKLKAMVHAEVTSTSDQKMAELIDVGLTLLGGLLKDIRLIARERP